MASKQVCWQCGGSLAEVPRPIRRLARCPHCRSDLHVCRLCRHYAPRYIGECAHDRAERVLDKTAANFCTHFRPRGNAHLPPADAGVDKASEALGALFGLDGGAAEVTEHAVHGPKRETADQARRKLQALFDLEPDDTGHRDDAADGEGDDRIREDR